MEVEFNGVAFTSCGSPGTGDDDEKCTRLAWGNYKYRGDTKYEKNRSKILKLTYGTAYIYLWTYKGP